MNIWIVNGFLGSGKTTFLNRCLFQDSNKTRACILNEFGSEAIDESRLEKGSIPLYSILNGSVFCACKWNEIAELLLRFFEQKIEEVVIETSGFTDPKAFGKLFCFLEQRDVEVRVEVITIVDATNYPKLSKIVPLLKKQVDWADYLIVSKNDLVSKEEYETLIRELPSEKIVDPMKTDWSSARFFDPQRKKFWVDQNEQRSITHRSCTILPAYDRRSDLENDLRSLLGKVYRIKGTVRIETTSWRVDGVWDRLEIEASSSDLNELVFLYDTKWIGKKEILDRIKGKENDRIEKRSG